MGYVNNILRKTTLAIRKIWTFSIFVIAKLNLRETVLNQKNAKHNSRENKLVYSNGYHMDIGAYIPKSASYLYDFLEIDYEVRLRSKLYNN